MGFPRVSGNLFVNRVLVWPMSESERSRYSNRAVMVYLSMRVPLATQFHWQKCSTMA